jgi:transposase-like protein
MGRESLWRVTQVDSTDLAIAVHVTYAYTPTSCPRCNSDRRPSRHGVLSANYRDVPFCGRQTTIGVDVQRFRCTGCKQAFLQYLPGMDGKRRMTARCATYVIDQVMARSSIGEVAGLVGLDEKTIRNVFDDRGLVFSVGDLPSSNRFICDSCLGIHPLSEHRLAPARHFGRWRATDLQREANVCKNCLAFESDPWRAGIVRRL